MDARSYRIAEISSGSNTLNISHRATAQQRTSPFSAALLLCVLYLLHFIRNDARDPVSIAGFSVRSFHPCYSTSQVMPLGVGALPRSSHGSARLQYAAAQGEMQLSSD